MNTAYTRTRKGMNRSLVFSHEKTFGELILKTFSLLINQNYLNVRHKKNFGFSRKKSNKGYLFSVLEWN